MDPTTEAELGITEEDLSMLKKHGFKSMYELAVFMSTADEGPMELIEYFDRRLPALEKAAASYALRKALRR